eukprot:c10182_g1_i1 orf=246-2348(+)
MADMNSGMNRSQCVPPPSSCLHIPALQACAEDLPLVLQRPDNFPLVMGILQEINQEKVGSSRGVESMQRPQDQPGQALTMSRVKLESVDIEDHHQNLYNMNSDLYQQEWSLKGFEELFTESEELQLRHDSYRQAHEALTPLDTSAPDEKPSFGLQSVHSLLGQRALDQARLLVDEKPPICLQLANSVREPISLQGKALPIEENPKVKEGPDASQAAVLANSKPLHAVQLPSQVHVEGRPGLGDLQVVKREPEGHGCCSEAQTQEEFLLPDACAVSSDAMPSEVAHANGSKVQSSGLPEFDLQLQLQMGIKKRWTVHNIQRTTGTILALPAEFSEQENNPGKDFPHKLPSTSKSLVAEGPMCPMVSSTKGTDIPQDSADFEVEDIKPQLVSSVVEQDCCELTLSLASAQPQTPNPGPHFSDCHALPEEKPVLKTLFVQEERYEQCQRTQATQWQQATKMCGSREAFRNSGQHTMPTLNQKQLFPSADGCMLASSLCCKDGEGLTEIMGNKSKSFEHRGSSLDDTHEKNVQNNLPLSNQGQLSSPTSNCISSCLDGRGSRRTLQLMPESVKDGGSSVEEGETRGFAAEDDQLVEPNPRAAMESLHNSSQAEQASEFNEPHKKRMRGTILIEEKGEKEKDTRCHRSDGKSWRCVRECINGAYYCQYHLRARRIGYNRRKNRDVSTDHVESVNKQSSKGKLKSR